MSAPLVAAMQAAHLSLERERKARATCSPAALQAHFAAVMGNALPEHLRESVDWSLGDDIQADTNLQKATATLRRKILRRDRSAIDELDPLFTGFESHVRWQLDNAREGLAAVVATLTDPDAPLLPDPTDTAAGPDLGIGAAVRSESKVSLNSLNDRFKQWFIETDDAIDQLEELIGMSVSGRTSAQVLKLVKKYDEQIKFISSKAQELAHVDKALAEVDTGVAELKANWPHGQPARNLYKSDLYKDYNEERKMMTAEKSLIEGSLQRYFDHASHGSSQAIANKTDKVQLALATDLEARKAGFRQIQLIDLYCLSRANEMWAILPSVTRVGHDIDPVKCMHWRPKKEDMPDSLRPYWEQQSQAFAKKLLAICTPGQRSTLLASHEHGTDKEVVQVSESCGVSIYWKMIQLYHPIGREQRRRLEKEIAGFSSRFKPGKGNPKEALDELREKHQEAMDIACRLKWDVVALPIINALRTRDTQFAVKLDPFLELPSDPDDSAVEFGDLLTTIGSVISHLNEAHKRWDEGTAKPAQNTHASDELAKLKAQVKSLTTAMAN